MRLQFDYLAVKHSSIITDLDGALFSDFAILSKHFSSFDDDLGTILPWWGGTLFQTPIFCPKTLVYFLFIRSATYLFTFSAVCLYFQLFSFLLKLELILEYLDKKWILSQCGGGTQNFFWTLQSFRFLATLVLLP